MGNELEIIKIEEEEDYEQDLLETPVFNKIPKNKEEGNEGIKLNKDGLELPR